MVEYSLVVASIFSFKTTGQWEHWDYYTAFTFYISCNIVFAIGSSGYLFIVRLSCNYHSIVLSCVYPPWTWGFLMCFCALFHLPNARQGYNYITLFVNCNSLSANLPNDLRLSREDLRGPPPCIILVSELRQLPYC